MIFTIEMHWKWFYYRNALGMIFTIKVLEMIFTIGHDFYYKNAFEMIFIIFDYLTKMGIMTVPHPPLLPVTFGYSLSSEAVVMRQLRKWKRLWHLHKSTSMGPSRSCWNGTTSALQLEEITSKGTRVSCVYYQ